MDEQQIYDEIADLIDENTMLKEAIDDLMEENKKLMKENRILKKKLGEVN